MAERTYNIEKITIGHMRAFCGIFKAIKEGRKEPLRILCKDQGVDEEFVSTLEQRLFGPARKEKLLSRSKDDRMTDHGEEVFRAFMQALDSINHIEEKGVVGIDQIKVQATRSTINNAILRAQQSYNLRKRGNSEAKRAELVVTDGFTDENIKAVREKKCHYGVGYTASLDVKCDPMLQTELVLICKKGDEQKTLDVLLKENDVLTFPNESVFSGNILELLPKLKRSTQPVILPGLVYTTEWVEAGLGIAFALRAFLPRGKDKELGIVPFGDRTIPVAVYLYRRDNWMDTYSRNAKAMGEHLVEAFDSLKRDDRIN